MLPETIDRYQILSVCGSGGMATVYKAFDPQRQQQIALKVLSQEFLQDQEYRERFKREIDIHSSFKHDAVVPIYGYGQYKGQLYLVQRFMPGGSLADRLKGGKKLPIGEVVALLRRIAPALDAAHRQGIVHRDMKPANILYDSQGLAYINDFGIARQEDQPNITSLFGTTMIGSPAYMSPEQGQGNVHLDGRCDLYSLGVMVYEMLSGQLPYYDDKPIKLTYDHMTKPIPDILTANPDLPPACKRFIYKAMAKKPADRFSSGEEMVNALASIIEPVSHAPASVPVEQKLKSINVVPSFVSPPSAGVPPRIPLSVPSVRAPSVAPRGIQRALVSLTGWLGLSESSLISRSPIAALLIFALSFLILIGIAVGLAAVCYIVYRLALVGAINENFIALILSSTGAGCL